MTTTDTTTTDTPPVDKPFQFAVVSETHDPACAAAQSDVQFRRHLSSSGREDVPSGRGAGR